MKKYVRIILPAIAAIGAFIAFIPAMQNGWVNWDDEQYVLNNGLIRSLNWDAIKLMFTTDQVAGLYHPLTLLSLAMDFHFAGIDPGLYHRINIYFHVINVILGFVFVRKLTGNLYVAFAVAVLFGLHPMNVESVAWVSARKNVLSVFFLLLALISYLQFSISKERAKKWAFYGATALTFMLACLSKPDAIVLPLLLWAIDYFKSRKIDRALWLEKIPFLIISVIVGLNAIASQESGKALLEIDHHWYETFVLPPFIAGSLFFKALLPVHLSSLHPFPQVESTGALQPWVFVASLVSLIIIVGALLVFRRRRYVVFGLLFFMIALLPYLQIIQFGMASYSERYAYLAYIGLFLIPAHFLFGDTSDDQLPGRMRLLTLILIAVLLGVQTFNRCKVWRTGETLWTDVIKKYPDHFYAYGARGNHYFETGDLVKAELDYTQCIEQSPLFPEVYNNRGLLYWEQKEYDKSLSDILMALKIDSTNANAWNNAGLIYLNKEELPTAAYAFDRALLLDSMSVAFWYNRGLTLQKLGNVEAAVGDYSRALSLGPNEVLILKERANALHTLKDYPNAMSDIDLVISALPQDGQAYFIRSVIYRDLGEVAAALRDAQSAQRNGYPVPPAYFQELQAEE